MMMLNMLAQEIRVTALLGTDRHKLAPDRHKLAPETSDELWTPLFAELAARPPEVQLLGAAAMVLLAREAARRAENDPVAPPAPAEPDTQPRCSESVARRFATMIGGDQRDVLPEALALLAATGKRLPEALLPSLLQVGRQHKDLHAALLTVIGRRGRWLAKQNPDWSYAAQSSLGGLFDESMAEEHWQTADRASRLALLQEMRTHAPERARALLEQTWPTERAEDRAAFLSLLDDGLSMMDEPFLEAALDDRSAQVRQAAVALLTCLPASRLVRRLTDHVAPLMALKRPLLGAPALEVSPPTAYDTAWRRDGIEEKSPFEGLGDRAGWLVQMLGRIAPNVWEARLQAPPDTLVQAAARGEWADAVLQGWQDAVECTHDARWSEALARHWLAARDHSSQPRSLSPRLAAGLTAAPFEALILQALRQDPSPLHDLHPALTPLLEYKGHWSEALSRAVVDSVRRRTLQTAEKQISAWRTMQSLRQFALRIPPHMADELSQGWPSGETAGSYLQNSIEKFRAVLHFRHDLHKEIAL